MPAASARARAVLLALAVVPSAAAAAPFDGSQAVDAWNGLVISSHRPTGLAGAYVGVAEGQDGAVFNPAATAHRDRRLDRGWDWDFVLNWLTPVDLSTQDLGNEGRADGSLSWRSSVQVGAELQLGRLGLGLLVRGWSVDAPGAAGDRLRLEMQDLALSCGWSFWREQLVVGVDLAAMLGRVGHATAGAPEGVLEYRDASHLRAGALWKPRGSPWRVGLLLDPGQTVGRSGPPSALAGVATPAAFAFPAVVSLGGSLRVGEDAALYNEPPPVALRDHPEWGGGREGPPPPDRGVLLSVQLDVVGASPGAVSPLAYIHQQTEPALPSGGSPALEPHLGAEWVAVDRWLVVRGGSYLEPSRVGAPPRLHLAAGASARLPWPTWPTDLRLGLALDAAERYSNLVLGIGTWR